MLLAKQLTQEKLTINIASSNLIILRITPNLDTMKEIILYFKICERLIMGFIKSRLNKDNFWNLMFWVGMTLFTVLGEYFNNIKLVEYSFFCFAGLGLPLIIKQVQDVKFDKKYGFFNNNGRSLGSAKDCVPKQLLFVIVLSIFLIIYLSSGKISLGFVALYWSILCLNITLYFIYKNCPISVIFNLNIFERTSHKELAAMEQRLSISKQTYNTYHSSSSSHYSIYGRHYR